MVNFLFAGLSELTFDLRPEIRKSALQVLFDTLRNHGHHFSLPLWERVFDSVLLPIFDYVRHGIDPSGETHQADVSAMSDELDQDAWLYETCTLALQLIVDLFVNFYETVGPLLNKVLTLLTSFIKRPHQSLAGIGIAAFVRLMSNGGALFLEDKWLEVVLSFKDAAEATRPDFKEVTLGVMADEDEDPKMEGETEGGRKMRNLQITLGNVKCRAAVQLLLIQVLIKLVVSVGFVLLPF